MAGSNPDLVIRVAANVAALQADMAAAVATLKSIDSAAASTAASSTELSSSFDKMGDGWIARVTEGVLLRDAIRGIANELVGLAKEAFTDASMFENLSRATGSTTDEIQRLSYVGAGFGVQTEQMGRGVEQLSAKLAGGDANATKAVQMLGLSVKDLLAAGPVEAFLEIGESTGHIEDPMLKAALASDEFGGKLAKILLPALGDLRQKLADVPKDALMSKETIQSAHDFDVALEHATTTVKAGTAEVLVASTNWYAWAGSFPLLSQAMLLFSDDLKSHAKDIKLVSDAHTVTISTAQALQNRLDALRTESLTPLTDAQKANILELKDWGEAEKDIAQLVGTNVVAVHTYIEAHKQLEAAAKETAKVQAAALLETTKLWDDYTDKIASLPNLFAGIVDPMGAAFDKQNQSVDAAQAKIDKYFLDLAAKEQKAGTDTDEFYAAWAADWDATSAHVSTGEDAVLAKYEAAEAKHLSLASEGVDAFGTNATAVLTGVGAAATATTAKIAATVAAWGSLASKGREYENPNGPGDVGGSFALGAVTVTAANKASLITELQNIEAAQAAYPGRVNGGSGPTGLAANDSAGWTALMLEQQRFAQLKSALPGYESGGPSGPGGLSMLHPDEYVVPKGGALVSGGGGGDTIHIHITQPLGTPAAIAAAVDQALMARQRNTGQRMPVSN